MKQYGYTWKAVPAKTQDGFTLMLFHIEGTEAGGKYKARRTPILIIPDLYSDAGRWLQMQSDPPTNSQVSTSKLPMMLQLAEAGYDVWVANNRGTDFSQDHRSLTPEDPEFWNFTWETMGKHDVPTMIRRVKEMTEMKKIFVIGYGQGAGMMFNALTNKDLLRELNPSLHKFIALSPCVMTQEKEHPDEAYYQNGLYKFKENGIYSIGGPNWENDLKKICSKFSQEVCDEWVAKTQLSESLSIRPQATSTDNLIYWVNNGFQKRFQDFAPNYSEGVTRTALRNFYDVKGTRVSMFVPENDELCPFEPLIMVKVENTNWMPNISHNWFDTGKTPQFMKELIAELKVAPKDVEVFNYEL